MVLAERIKVAPDFRVDVPSFDADFGRAFPVFFLERK
jgi:hypothetical protein